MAYHDVEFPDRIAEGAEGGPEFMTAIIGTSGGYEQRIANWASGRGRWNVGTGIEDAEQYADVIAFFRARMGRLHSFPFHDWSDDTLARQAIGATNGSNATFQIFKLYTSSVTYSRDITKPRSGTVRVWVDGVERAIGAGGSQFQVNLLTGVVTLGATLAALSAKAVEASCEFRVPVRFDVDHLNLRLKAYQVGEWADIPVVEVRGE